MNPTVLAIVGPTAVGKSAVAEIAAERLSGAIISADSMQVYRGMDIGTAKTAAGERRVPYHLVDVIDPGTPYSAALYQTAARSVADDLIARHLLPVFVGGTGLYVRAALDEMSFPAGDASTDLRRAVEQHAAQVGAEALHAELAALDPEAARLIHPNNVKRVVRALEMHAVGASYAEQAATFARRTFHYSDTLLVGLTMDRTELYRRIDARVDQMICSGLVSEVQALLEQGLRSALTSAQAIGYKEIVPVIDGESSIDAARDAIQQATRRYAKRQLTWFRADPRIQWIDTTGLTAPEAASRVFDLIESLPTTPAGGHPCV